VLGVWLAQSRRADLIVRPILDAAQAMPAFVYLVPAVALFNPTRFSAIVAGLVFAVPVVTKIVADGIRGVPVPVVEAATASGSNRWQLLGKVQLPLALPTLAVAANQGLIYVLSVVVLGGMVGSGALGYLSVYGFSQSEAWGKGFVAGLNIVVLAIMLDRVTQRAVRRAQGTHR
jgi:glycine betaine/proline transport system permease protein